MKGRLCALILALSLCLSGCAAMLERSYQVSAPHVDRPVTAEDSSILRVKDYRELVSAVLYLVSQGEESGTIQLIDYPDDVETALAAACLEVATEDPLGAYCVDYIEHTWARVVSYDQAAITIQYRRTPEQVRSMVNVTGTSAIRTKLEQALRSFAPEVVLRVAYFAEDRASITDLIRQAYYAAPANANGMPQAEIALYPDSGRERVVEILLTYPRSAEELTARGQAVAQAAEALTAPLTELSSEPATLAEALALALIREAGYDPQGEPTPYAALVEGAADSEGMALAYAVLCRAAGLTCRIVEGTLPAAQGQEPTDGASGAEGDEQEPGRVAHLWNGVTIGREWLYLDPSSDHPVLLTARELVEQGYDWSGAPAIETAETSGGQ